MTNRFTDTFFAFPIKIFDGDSIERHMKVAELLDQHIEPEWVIGTVKVPAQWFVDDKVCWNDGYTKGRSLSDVEREGFDNTQVDVDGAVYCCVWERRKFEEKLNEFMERYTGNILKEISNEEEVHHD
jgi:hypothetical protein